MRTFPILAGASILALLSGPVVPAKAEVVRMEITGRTPVARGHVFGAAGAYERIDGRLSGEDGRHPSDHEPVYAVLQ